MNDMTMPVAPTPTVEQLNLEYRLSQSKVSEAVQHAITCGLMLLQVKASLAHGQCGAWLDEQRKSGAIEFTNRTARKYMRVASNRNRGFDLETSPSIRAALELLTDKDELPEPPGLDLETEKERERRIKAEARAAEAAFAAGRAEQEKATAEQCSEEWRQQAIAEKKRREEHSQLAATAQAEAATLRKTLAADAKKLAAARVAEINGDLGKALIDKAELTQKLKAAKKDQDAAVEARTQQALRAQQDEINRMEAQLQAVEGRIAVLNGRLDAFNDQDRAVTHYTERRREIRSAMDALSLHLTRAFDPDYASFLPAPFVSVFERVAAELAQGAADVRAVLDRVEILQIEVAVHE
ncbi:hypothetical protein [uncultured Thiodictyon sp.]|uniref:hypothetical protein n=1 Tax=uncultured Thiodictyon sp. TaxID=1846217 RepID=UPI0025FB7FB9|nr:hypothetical protein [uncultured Thiodictyon sp.]